MGQKKGFNAPVTVLSGIDGIVQSTNRHIQRRKSACKHNSFVNMAAMFFLSCNNLKATTWKTVFNKVGGGGHEYELVYFKQSNINILVPYNSHRKRIFIWLTLYWLNINSLYGWLAWVELHLANSKKVVKDNSYQN